MSEQVWHLVPAFLSNKRNQASIEEGESSDPPTHKIYVSMFYELWIWVAKDAEIVYLLGVSLATIKRYDPRNDERKGMCDLKRSLAVRQRNGCRLRRACCLNYRRMLMPPWSTIV